MEWMNRAAPRSAQPAGTTVTPSTGGAAPHGNGHSGGSKKKLRGGFSPMRLAAVFLIVAATTLVLGVIWLAASTKTNTEAKFVEEGKMQAVFLTGGQVYFGNIDAMNNSYLSLENIYYLRVNQQVQPKQGEAQSQGQDISLVKLGCELHGPEDKMLINRDQVIFWENLKTDGQVAKAVAEYVKANPQGQNCNAQQNNNSNNTNTNTNTTNNNSTNNTNTNNTNTNNSNNTNRNNP